MHACRYGLWLLQARAHAAAARALQEGRLLAPTSSLDDLDPEHRLQGDLILAPPSILKSNWISRLGDYKTAFASGWMQGSSFAHGASYDHGFVISDHADWNDINQTIDETEAKQIFVLHRGNGALIRHLQKRGKKALALQRFELCLKDLKSSVLTTTP